MSGTSVHHVGLRVTDMDRAAAVYIEALGGRWEVLPVRLEGATAMLASGVPDARMLLALVRFGDVLVELFAYDPDAAPDWAQAPPAGRLPHLCLRVDDTVAALRRAEDAGCQRIWDEIVALGAAGVIYLRDPFGNVIELVDGPADAITASLRASFPDGRPSA